MARRRHIAFTVTAIAVVVALALAWAQRASAPSPDASTSPPSSASAAQLPDQLTAKPAPPREPDTIRSASVMVAIRNVALTFEGCDDTRFDDLVAELEDRSLGERERRRKSDAEQERIKNALTASADFEHQHVLAVMTRSPEGRLQHLNAALKTAPDDVFLLWDAVHLCSKLNDADGCDLPALQARLQILDGDNSETWMAIAISRAADGNMNAALQALQTAATATRSSEFFVARVARMERGMTAAGGIPFGKRVVGAIGYAAASDSPDYGEYITMCKDGMKVDAAWAYACAEYATTAEQQAETIIGSAIAMSLQKLAYEFLGDSKKLEALAERRAVLSQFMDGSPSDADDILQYLIGSDPTFFAAYLDSIRTHGELNTRERLRTDIETALEENNAPRCHKKAPDEPGLP